MDWGCLSGDVEEEYLGQEPVDGKVAWLQYTESKRSGMKSYKLEDLVPSMNMDGMGALERMDKAITNLGALLWSPAQGWEEEKAFIPWGRTNSLVRSSYEDADVKTTIRRNMLGSDDAEELDDYVNFIEGRKLCVLYFVDNEGGELEFMPKPEAYDYSPATIPLSRNKLVIFRCDQLGLDFSYKPKGKSLCLQAWILDRPATLRETEEMLRFIDGPEEPE